MRRSTSSSPRGPRTSQERFSLVSSSSSRVRRSAATIQSSEGLRFFEGETRSVVVSPAEAGTRNGSVGHCMTTPSKRSSSPRAERTLLPGSTVLHLERSEPPMSARILSASQPLPSSPLASARSGSASNVLSGSRRSLASSRAPSVGSPRPHRAGVYSGLDSRRRSLPGNRSLSQEFAALREFASKSGHEGLVAAAPELAAFFEDLAGHLEVEIQRHVAQCSKCRAFSLFSRSVGTKSPQQFTESALATLCKPCLGTLNQQVFASVQRRKDEIISEIADSLAVTPDTFAAYRGVAAQRRQCTFESLVVATYERDRVIQQEGVREELKPILTKLSHVRAAQQAWHELEWPLRGRRIPHLYRSNITSGDVEAYAARTVRNLTTAAITARRAWEERWPQHQFDDVFSVFGDPIFRLECLRSGDAFVFHPSGRLSEEDDIESTSLLSSRGVHDVQFDDVPLDSQQVAAARQMTSLVRVREAQSHEAGDDVTAVALEDGATVAFKLRPTRAHRGCGDFVKHTLQFNMALRCSQAQLFARSGVKELVHKACEGASSTIFAYGQTGAGKTYSLFGRTESLHCLAGDTVLSEDLPLPQACIDLVNEARRAKVRDQGLLPRAIYFLFKVLRSMGSSAPRRIRASFMEIYNEKVFDLLNPSGGALEVHQRPGGGEQGFHVPGLTLLECGSPEDLMQLVRRGVLERHTSSHSASRESSRAHAIFTIELEQSRGEKPGRLVFADLAGSERSKRIVGADVQETGHINRSLLMLSNCVSALAGSGSNTSLQAHSSTSIGSSERRASSATPLSLSSAFRNSKLTMVLMDSLRGAGYTLLLAAVSPALQHADETANTLEFAAKCANIKRQSTIKLSANERETRALRETIQVLRAELAEAKRAAAAAAAAGADDGAVSCNGTNGQRAGSMDNSAISDGDAQAEAEARYTQQEQLRAELKEEQARRKALEAELEALRGQMTCCSASGDAGAG